MLADRGGPQAVDGPRVRAGIRAMPVTVTLIAVLLVTTVLLRHVSPAMARALLAASSTDVAHLAHDPVRVLFASAIWLPDGIWLPYAVVFVLALGPLERRLGSLGALGVFLSGHVLATLLTEGPVAVAIIAGWLPAASGHRMDVGVSYGMYAALGAVFGLLEPRSRRLALGVVWASVLLPLVLDPDLTTVGHPLSLSIGVAWWPVLQRRGWFGTVHPAAGLRTALAEYVTARRILGSVTRRELRRRPARPTPTWR